MRAGTSRGPSVTRRVSTACLALGVLAGLWSAAPASAQERPRVVDVVQVSGYLDPITMNFLNHSLDDAERRQVEALVVQLDSGGAVVPQADVDALALRFSHGPVPVAVWVG